MKLCSAARAGAPAAPIARRETGTRVDAVAAVDLHISTTADGADPDGRFTPRGDVPPRQRVARRPRLHDVRRVRGLAQ